MAAGMTSFDSHAMASATACACPCCIEENILDEFVGFLLDKKLPLTLIEICPIPCASLAVRAVA